MKSKLLILFAALFVVLALCGYSEAQSDFDGDFWIPKTDSIKLMYVVGFVDGRNHGVNDAAEAMGITLEDPRISKLNSTITVGQIIDGVNDFYKDWRNRKILLRHAIQYVLDEADGKDDSALLLVMRKEDSQRKK